MFEISRNDYDALDYYVNERIAYPNAEYDFTFENRFLIYHAPIRYEWVYFVLDMKTNLSSEAHHCKKPMRMTNPREFVPFVLDAIRYTGDRRYINSMSQKPIELIDSLFRNVLTDYGFTVREEQIELSKQIYRGLTSYTASLCEAEVGTGKTLAYLIASVVARKLYGLTVPITITTSNIELQKALIEKEIPRLSKILMDYRLIDEPLKAVLRKGKEHFFCRLRFEDYINKIAKYPSKYEKILAFFDQTDFAHRAFDLDTVKIPSYIKNKFCVKGCREGCDYADECKYYRYTRSANNSPEIDFQVTNHNLFLTSERLRKENEAIILKPSDYVIIDEAHKLKSSAEDVFGETLSESDINKYIRMVKYTLTSDSELYLVIYAGFAQSESESISKNITWTFRKKFEEGTPIFMYKKWLGYKKGEDGSPEIVPDEAKIVERIYDLYLSGETAQSISDLLKSENIEIPGKTFTFSKHMIMNILTNERYSGDSILQKTVTLDCIGKIRKKNTGEAPMYYVHNSHPAIINREKFNKVQEEMVRRKNKSPQLSKQSLTSSGKYSKNALTDVMICGECGSRYKRCIWSKYGKKKVVWRCSSRLEHGTRYCKNSPTIPEMDIKQAVVRAIQKFCEEDENAYMTLMKATLGEAMGLNYSSEEVDLLERRIESLNKQMLNLVSQSVSNGVNIDTYENEFKEIAEEINQLKSRINAITECITANENFEERMARLNTVIDERVKHQDEYDEAVVRQMIECIKVCSDRRVEIHFGGKNVINLML